MNIREQVIQTGIVPVVVIERLEDSLPLAKALLEGGNNLMEVTLRTECALEAIRMISENEPDVIVGAGTVLSVKAASNAIMAGARFIVCPGLDTEIINYCNVMDVLCIPGCVTPTEIMRAISMNVEYVKFFPAGIYGGVKALKSLTEPFSDIKFIPTGGINPDNLEDYLRLKSVVAVGGSWICNKIDVRNHEFEKITKLTQEALDIVDKIRKEG